MNEIWRDIPGYEGLYQVSNYGNVRSMNYMNTGTVKVLKQKVNNYGYSLINLNYNGERKTYSVHRLVTAAFLENPDNKPQVNHIDGCKINNNVSNLEYVTPGDNQKHAYDTGLKNSQGSYEANRKPVRCITTGKEFASINEAALYYNINRRSIGFCLSGKQKSAGKYNGQKLQWEFIN